MSLLVRSSAPLRQVARTSVRNMSSHGEYKHIPFDYDNRGIFAAKVATYLIGGFSIPFFAAWWQLKKSGGA